MRKGLMAGVIGAAAIAAVSLAPSASADSAYDNYRYIQGLNNNGIYIINTNVAINTGHNICTNLENGATAYDEQQRVYNNNPALAWRGAYNWVSVATQYNCPQFNYLVYAPENY